MHVPDGFLSPEVTLPAFAAAAPLWAWSVRRHFGSSAAESLPVMGSLTALSFVLQTILVPVPGGTSVHLVGVTLLAILYDPLLSFACETLVLLVQALFFGTGGVTVLGVNAIAIGLAGPTAGWLVFRLARPLGERAAAFAAGFAGMQVSTLAAALALGLQNALSERYFPLPLRVTLAAVAVPSLAAGLVEGAYTAAALRLLRKATSRVAP